MNRFVVGFKNRNACDISNKYLVEIYMNGPKFDIDLISSDQKTIRAHKCVVSMYSIYLKDYIRELNSEGKEYILLSDISSHVLKQVIDLFYNGQIVISGEVKPYMIKALVFLKVPDVLIQPAKTQQPTAPSNNVRMRVPPVVINPRYATQVRPPPMPPTLHSTPIIRDMNMVHVNNAQCNWDQVGPSPCPNRSQFYNHHSHNFIPFRYIERQDTTLVTPSISSPPVRLISSTPKAAKGKAMVQNTQFVRMQNSMKRNIPGLLRLKKMKGNASAGNQPYRSFISNQTPPISVQYTQNQIEVNSMNIVHQDANGIVSMASNLVETNYVEVNNLGF
ncbi:dual specificity protein kinase splA-like [Contarinia nasturtii]|uniref:dual specificity protein kinase splA-like n=1 Tax=Contarinia nasturtii TaxID=265458 RepID=UPI0012D47444|nr:dual specificity protein kinase splA-like [Contarinia nasturtii]